MGLFDRFKKQTAPLDLREALLEAVERQDMKTLVSLCGKHQAEIRKAFPGWCTVPAEIRNDRKACDRYIQGLAATASCFEQAGDRSLMALLTGGQSSNPLIGWEKDLTEANRLLANEQFEQVLTLLEATLGRTRSLAGSAADEYRAKSFGVLGSACFKLGIHAKALGLMEKARDLCAQIGDAEGVKVYERNLAHIRSSEAGNQTTQPDEIVFKDKEGRILTAGDLTNLSGSVSWEISASWGGGDGKSIPAEARRLHEQGRTFGAKGEHAKAAAAFEQAGRLAPVWPFPIYDLAYTHLLEGKSEQALANYLRVDKLEPRGFFTTKTAIWTLEREQSGQFDRGTYLAYLSIEWTEDEAKKIEIARKLVEKFPGFAPAWKEVGLAAENSDEALRCYERGLSANPDPETYGMLQINKAIRLANAGKREEAVAILGELALDPKSSLAASQMAKTMLANFIKP